MRFLLDESVEYRIAPWLAQEGHDDVTAVGHDYPHALPDEEVLAIARTEGRILLTNDQDFGELIARLGLPHTGVIWFRGFRAATAETKFARLREVLVSHRKQLDQFLIVRTADVRMHRPRRP